MKNLLIIFFISLVYGSCSSNNNNTKLNFDYDGSIFCETTAPHIINDPIKFKINDFQYKGSIINGAPKIISYTWDLNCDAKEIITTDDIKLTHTFTKFGLYKICFKIKYYLENFPDNIKEYVITKNNFSDIISIKPKPRIYVAGSFRTFGTSNSNRISAIDLDTGVLNNSINFKKGFNSIVYALAKFDNKLYVAGSFSKYGTNYNLSAPKLIRLDANGNRDDDFNPNGIGADSTIFSIYIDENINNYDDNQPRIYIAGSFTTYNGIPINRIARLYLDGSLDTNFNPPSSINNIIYSVKIKNDKIYIGGSFTKGILCLNIDDGTIDDGFNVGDGIAHAVSTSTPNIRDIAIQDDGKIIIAGNFNFYNNTSRNYIVRLNADGTIDNTFIGENAGTSGNIRALLLQENKIILAGNFTSYQNIEGTANPVNNIVRLNLNDGSVDNSFNHNGIGANDVIRAIYFHDNAIYIGGIFSTYNSINKYYLAKLDNNGILIDSFNTTNLNGSIETILIYNNLLIVGGDIIDASKTGVLANRFHVLNKDGEKDSSFNSGYGFNNEVYDFIFDADYNIIVAGSFVRYNNKVLNRIVRLFQDGSIDDSFNIGSGFNSAVRTVKIDNKQRIIVAGNFTSYNGVFVNKILRLNNDGSIDNSFNPGTGEININTYINVEILNDNKILIAGDFTKFNGNDVNRILLLNEDGTINYDFNEGYLGANNPIYTLKVFNNKIYIGGSFTNYKQTNANRLLRLDINGNIDTTFNIGSGPNEIVRDIAIDEQGNIIVAGHFTLYNDSSKKYIMRLDKYGNLDNSFNKHNYINNNVYTVTLNFNNACIIGGTFDKFNTLNVNKFLKLNSSNGEIDELFDHVGFDEGNVLKVTYY